MTQSYQPPPSFGMMQMISAPFTPIGPAFAPPGTYPGSTLQRSTIGIMGGVAQAAGIGADVLAGGMPVAAGIGGFAAGGFGGAIAAAGPTALLAAPVYAMGRNLTMTAQNMSAVTNIMQSQRFMFGRSGTAPTTGGFTGGQIAGVAGGIEEAGLRDANTTVVEARNIFNQLTQMGSFQAAKDVPEILQKFTESMKAIRQIAVSLQTTFTEATQIVGVVRGMGITSPGEIANIGRSLAVGQRGGVSAGQQLEAMAGASQTAMSMGFAGRGAAMGALQGVQDLGRARQLGIVSEQDFMTMTGGTGNAAVAMQQRTGVASNVSQSHLGLLYGAANITTGQMGSMRMGDMATMAAGNLSSPDAMVATLNRRDQITESLRTNPWAMAEMSSSFARSMPGIDPREAQTMFLRNQGYSDVGARSYVKEYRSRDITSMMGQMESERQAEQEAYTAKSQNLAFTGSQWWRDVGNAVFQRKSMAAGFRSMAGGAADAMSWIERKRLGLEATYTMTGSDMTETIRRGIDVKLGDNLADLFKPVTDKYKNLTTAMKDLPVQLEAARKDVAAELGRYSSIGGGTPEAFTSLFVENATLRPLFLNIMKGAAKGDDVEGEITTLHALMESSGSFSKEDMGKIESIRNITKNRAQSEKIAKTVGHYSDLKDFAITTGAMKGYLVNLDRGLAQMQKTGKGTIGVELLSKVTAAAKTAVTSSTPENMASLEAARKDMVNRAIEVLRGGPGITGEMKAQVREALALSGQSAIVMAIEESSPGLLANRGTATGDVMERAAAGLKRELDSGILGATAGRGAGGQDGFNSSQIEVNQNISKFLVALLSNNTAAAKEAANAVYTANVVG
jgi:hypothetical protein